MISTLLDESDDHGHRQQLSLFIRSISKKGEIEVDFMGLQETEDRSAEGIWGLLQRWFTDKELDLLKVAFDAMDTTNCM